MFKYSSINPRSIKRYLHRLIGLAGYRLDRISKLISDVSHEDLAIAQRVKPFTMTSIERLVTTIDAARYTISNDIPGAIVECGVWRGGCIMAIIDVLLSAGCTDREIWLYDTYEGMPAPTSHDAKAGRLATPTFEKLKISDDSSNWCRASLDDVRHNVLSTGYPESAIHFIKGKVQDTLSLHTPGPIALLRLDTDFYESSKAEMEHLYPLLSPSGVLILDDYGMWLGARKAVDEYFDSHPPKPFLARADMNGRVAIKP